MNVLFLHFLLDKHLFIYYNNYILKNKCLMSGYMIKCSINYKLNLKRIVLNVLLILAVFMLFEIITSYGLGKEEIKTYELKVNDKDTLWDIASIISSKNNMEIHKVIYDIQDVNGMSSSKLYKDQILLIPIYD